MIKYGICCDSISYLNWFIIYIVLFSKKRKAQEYFQGLVLHIPGAGIDINYIVLCVLTLGNI